MKQRGFKKYMRQVSKCLDCSWAQKKSVLSGLRSELEECMETQNISDYEELVELFGAPEKVAEELAAGSSFAAGSTTLVKQKRKFLIVLGICAVVIIALSIFLALAVNIQAGYSETTLVIYQ